VEKGIATAADATLPVDGEWEPRWPRMMTFEAL
jgi:hypothetical protein